MRSRMMVDVVKSDYDCGHAAIPLDEQHAATCQKRELMPARGAAMAFAGRHSASLVEHARASLFYNNGLDIWRRSAWPGHRGIWPDVRPSSSSILRSYHINQLRALSDDLHSRCLSY